MESVDQKTCPDNQDAEFDQKIDFNKFFVIPLKLVGLLAVIVATLPFILILFSWFVDYLIPDSLEEKINNRIRILGTYGDMFGMLNSVFSGAAFCAIFYTLRIQQKQHDLQKEDIDMKKAKPCLEIDEIKSKSAPKYRIPGDTKKDESLKSENDDGLYNATYARLVLINKSEDTPAINCRVLLTSIEKYGTNNKYYEMEEYQNTLRLLQFTEQDGAPEERGVVIPCFCPNYFNIFSLKEITRDGEPDRYFQVAHAFSKYNVTRNILKMRTKYKIFMSVVSDNASAMRVCMEISIGANWESLQVLEVQRL